MCNESGYIVLDTVNFLTADGLKFTHPLHHLGKTAADLPILAIDSFQHMYLWSHDPKTDIRFGLTQVFMWRFGLLNCWWLSFDAFRQSLNNTCCWVSQRYIRIHRVHCWVVNRQKWNAISESFSLTRIRSRPSRVLQKLYSGLLYQQSSSNKLIFRNVWNTWLWILSYNVVYLVLTYFQSFSRGKWLRRAYVVFLQQTWLTKAVHSWFAFRKITSWIS